MNDQPWARPVDTRDTNLGLRFEYRLADGWKATIAGNKHWFKRDDYTAFPYGCSNEGEGFYPGYCSNGDYDVYDYQSVGERKTPWGLQAMLQGRFATGALRHQLTVGASYAERHDSFGDYVYDYVGYSNIWHPLDTPHVGPDRVTGPVFERRSDQESALFAQDIVTITPQLTLHGGLRYVQTKRSDWEEDRPAVHTAGYVASKDSFLLPSVALVYGLNRDWNVYGSVSHGLQHGGIAPMETANENQVMDPGRSKQFEIGTKGSVAGLNLSASLFQIRQGLEYTDPNRTVAVVVDGETLQRHPYVRGGRETHRGLELAADGKAGEWPAGRRVADGAEHAPGRHRRRQHRRQARHRRPQLQVDRLDRIRRAAAARPEAGRQLAVFGQEGLRRREPRAGAGLPRVRPGRRLRLKLGATRVTLRARVDNLFDKFYWRDVTPALGGYLLPGAPRTFRVSASSTFKLAAQGGPSSSSTCRSRCGRSPSSSVNGMPRSRSTASRHSCTAGALPPIRAAAVRHPGQVQARHQRRRIIVFGFQRQQLGRHPAPVDAAVDRRHQRRGVAEQEAPRIPGRRHGVLACALGARDVELVVFERHPLLRLDEFAQVFRHPQRAVARRQRRRQGRLAGRLGAEDGNPLQWQTRAHRTPSRAARAQVRRPSAAIATNSAYRIAVRCRPL
jgi:hypothetical protein